MNTVARGKRRHIYVRLGVVEHSIKYGVISFDYVSNEKRQREKYVVNPFKGLAGKIVLDSSRGMSAMSGGTCGGYSFCGQTKPCEDSYALHLIPMACSSA
jgi:hypothetical protein